MTREMSQEAIDNHTVKFSSPNCVVVIDIGDWIILKGAATICDFDSSSRPSYFKASIESVKCDAVVPMISDKIFEHPRDAHKRNQPFYRGLKKYRKP